MTIESEICDGDTRAVPGPGGDGLLRPRDRPRATPPPEAYRERLLGVVSELIGRARSKVLTMNCAAWVT